ncbi:MAG: SIMPL domain-containing protein [Clostridia bacterium]|nr:SIMPL domain-containing protein [Clostridia bacterium]
MKKILAFVLALTMMLCAGIALADDADITVQGTAVISANPDMVSVTANASVSGKTVAGAQEEISRIIESVTTKLIELGVGEEDIITQDYGYYPTYNYESDTRTLTGYQANHTLKITCRDVEMLDSVIGVVTDCGMSEIYNVSYDVSTRSELYQQALAMAIEAARAKAEKMAQASGMTLTGLDSLTENGGYAEAYAVNSTADMAKASAGSAGTGIRAGGVSVTASVTAVYEARK